MEIIMEKPTKSRFILKYNNKKHIFILKVTDGTKITLKKSNADTDYDEV